MKLGSRLGVLGVVIIAAAMSTPMGQVLLSFLPFIGNDELGEGSVNYRKALFENSMEVIKRWPLFGNPRYLNTPWMQAMRQGEGVIDVLNVYLSKGMRHGVPVMLLYIIAHFGPSIMSLFQLRAYKDKEDLHWRNLGLGIAGGTLIYAISYTTTAKNGFAPEIGWMLIGLTVAHYRISRSELFERTKMAKEARRKSKLAALAEPAVAYRGQGV